MLKRSLPILLVLTLLSCGALAADVEYSTTGTMGTPATHGGDRDGWGTDFITRWDNDTGHDVLIEEFGWPVGGWWAQFWYVWISDTLPPSPYVLQHYGSYVALSEDDTEYPPSLYTHIDMTAEGIVIPAGASMYFGYGNPGMGGQILFNGVTTYSWLNENWDRDGDFNRTAIIEFRGSFTDVSAVGDTPTPVNLLGNHPNPFNPRTTISFTLSRTMDVDLGIYSLTGGLVRSLRQGNLGAGPHEAAWNGTDDHGRSVPSGTYLVRLVTTDGIRAKKILMVK